MKTVAQNARQNVTFRNDSCACFSPRHCAIFSLKVSVFLPMVIAKQFHLFKIIYYLWQTVNSVLLTLNVQRMMPHWCAHSFQVCGECIAQYIFIEFEYTCHSRKIYVQVKMISVGNFILIFIGLMSAFGILCATGFVAAKQMIICVH